MKKIALAILLAASLAACSDPQKATRALSDQGYTNVKTTGWAMFGCDEKDTFHTGFTATGPTGHDVHGVVCNGFFKGATVRTF